jgi:hypothetical protein
MTRGVGRDGGGSDGDGAPDARVGVVCGACGARVRAKGGEDDDDVWVSARASDDDDDDVRAERSSAHSHAAANVDAHWERLSAHEFGAGAHDEDARLVAFLELALAARGGARALEANSSARTSLCPILIAAFVSTAHTDRIGHVIAGLTFGCGFLASEKDAWLRADEPSRDALDWLVNTELVEFDHAPIALPARGYEHSTYFTEQFFYLLRNAQYERGVWFERLFTSLKHYAHDLSVRLKDDGPLEDVRRRCTMSSNFLYTHLRLLETSILYMPQALLDVGAKHASLAAELIEFIHHNKFCDFEEALRVALFGVCVADRDVQRMLCQKLYKTSAGVPDFSRLLDVDVTRIRFQTCSSACTTRIVQRIKEKVEEEIQSMRDVPKERDFSADAPEEFLDSITGFIMVNPVRLQSSSMCVDASTIARLKEMGSKNDPFTGCPIEFDQCEIDLAMKQRLDAWYATVKAKLT